MSYTLTLKSRDSSTLKAIYFPPINLSEGEWSIALVNLETYNSIPNITETQNKLHLGTGEIVIIPTGTYSINDIFSKIKQSVKGIELHANINTFKTEIRTAENTIDFSHNGSIGPILGFTKKQILEKNAEKFYESDSVVNIQPVSTIRVECNVVTNSYLNNRLVHTIYEFFPKVPAGHKIIEIPSNPIYLPVIVQTLDHTECAIVDQNVVPLDFRGEEIVVRLHLKKRSK